MNNQDGQVLTPSVAQELIVELFAGATVRKQEIVRAVAVTMREMDDNSAIWKCLQNYSTTGQLPVS